MAGLDLFLRLPSSAFLFILLSVLIAPTVGAHALPRQTVTVTVEHRTLDVLPYPPLPTAAPAPQRQSRRETRWGKRQDDEGALFNTICGYVGGDPDLPATCSAGSHCVVDAHAGAIGCCPDSGSCTTGIFTGCVDANSGPQTEVNPYVHTCSGSDVCYRNVFEGGNFQFGCGSASTVAATVLASASGQTDSGLSIASVSADMTREPSTLPTPTVIGSVSTASTDESSTTESSSSASTSSESSSNSAIATPETTASRSSSSSSESASPSDEPEADASEADAPDAGGGGVNRKGAIIGGSISGAAVLVGLLAVAFYLFRRRQRGNKREGPGPGPDETTQYISPMSGGGKGFAPVAPSQEAYEQAYMPDSTRGANAGVPLADPGQHPDMDAQDGHSRPSPWGYGPSGEVVAIRGAAGGENGDPHGDEVPLTSEYQDFTRGFNEALTRIDEEDNGPNAAAQAGGMGRNDNGNGNGYGYGDGGGRDGDISPPTPYSPRGEEGPLWQQNRRRGKNMMWMEE